MRDQKEILSYSKVSQHAECPYKFYIYNITKEVKDTGNKFTVEGEIWHKELELYVLRGQLLNQALHAKPMADYLRSLPGKNYCEIKMGINDAGEYVQDFFSGENFFRGILDFVNINGEDAMVVDWKVGKRKLSKFQLLLFAVFVFARWPQVNKVKSAFFWAKTHEIDPMTFVRSQLPQMMELIRGKTSAIQHDFESNIWAATPSEQKCKWCGARDLCQDRI
jgi:hypothetical protein